MSQYLSLRHLAHPMASEDLLMFHNGAREAEPCGCIEICVDLTLQKFRSRYCWRWIHQVQILNVKHSSEGLTAGLVSRQVTLQECLNDIFCCLHYSPCWSGNRCPDLHDVCVIFVDYLISLFAMWCSISPILFVTDFKIILRGARQVVGGIKLPSDKRLPPLSSYMDDIISILQTAPCTAMVFSSFDELITWARKKINAEKSRSPWIRKGLPEERTTFFMGLEPITRLAKKSLKILGSPYTANLSDRQMGKLAK